MKYIVSACLAGHKCRYDGGSRLDERIIRLVKAGDAIPVCPEGLSGLPVPRPPAEQRGSRMIDRDGRDVTEYFLLGGQRAFRIAERSGCKRAILKARSPSCGVGKIYDGSFTGTLCEGNGIFADLLLKAGFELFDEDTWDEELCSVRDNSASDI